jgi:hypothetical protein
MWRANKKAAPGSGLFISYPIVSEYQMERENMPNIFGVFGVEAACFHGSLLWFLGPPLDKK